MVKIAYHSAILILSAIAASACQGEGRKQFDPAKSGSSYK